MPRVYRTSQEWVPADRIIPVFAGAGRFVWGCGRWRAEAVRQPDRTWRWRVWRVWGDWTEGRGWAPAWHAARSGALAALAGVAGVLGPERGYADEPEREAVGA